MIDSEFVTNNPETLNAGGIFRHDHFSARELCSEDQDKFKVNANMCASENIIGPISDLIHITTEEEGEEFDQDEEDLEDARRERLLQDIRTLDLNKQDIVENLFFFTEMEEFSSHRYEYLSPTESSKGFVFALFVPDKDWDGYGYGFEDEEYDHLSVSNTLKGLSEHNMDKFLGYLKN